jgi:hypothetical protein
MVEYLGRNEQVNTHADHLADRLRNAVVGIASLIGLSDIQWKKHLKYLMRAGT